MLIVLRSQPPLMPYQRRVIIWAGSLVAGLCTFPGYVAKDQVVTVGPTAAGLSR